MIKQTLNKGISTPIAIGIVLILVILVGSFTWLKYGEIRRETDELPEVELPKKEEVKDETADWEVYRNEEYGFEIKYHQDWMITADDYRENIPEVDYWGSSDDWFVFFDTNIDKEDKDVVIHLFIRDKTFYKNRCEQELDCGYRDDLIFSDDVSIYYLSETKGWIIEDENNSIGVRYILDLGEGKGYIDRIGIELRIELEEQVIKILESLSFN